ncbi:2-oxoglutarate dehydrogenase E1 component [Candidatus Erwinia haradaeae]|uniref:oxoglutarate dehydrogenase (succinyl-transferring) n=1 Tax=Candidatus Erwinia haradaeae TaxID=1922217 RepID=A0A451D3T6_9GAMM|nr:2-oxoglutarate dehydrogenase E1 component [Candidatus Erwinia haradaeae]VFP80326.1 2-oxoglutarate dehydrogenase E1 component [Candidatus Erwinia haradaeae]
MQNIDIKLWLDSSWLAGANQSYIECLFEDFLKDPHSVSVEWNIIFRKISNSISRINSLDSIHNQNFFLETDFICDNNINNSNVYNENAKISNLINAFRCIGYQNACLDPLKLQERKKIEELDLEYHGLNSTNLQDNFRVHLWTSDIQTMKLIDIHSKFQNIYCDSIGVEYMYITDLTEKQWIQKRLELVDRKKIFSYEKKREFLKILTAAEGLERYLGSKFPGAKRFSLEGGDALILILHEIIHHSGTKGIQQIILGMAHRGRLNVLINIFGKKPQDLFGEFSGQNPVNTKRSGDVKYHLGFSSDIKTKGGIIHLVLAHNPSHLEIINPVVMGATRARIDCLPQRNNTRINNNKILPITIHGDASIIGQGIVQETLNISKVRGYEVGGTIRIIINNQIGFTTSNIQDSRSTQHCTDIGKIIMAPIFHVMADDPEAVAFVTKLALDFRHTFKKDVFIDLVCYRRHGHNEADEPTVTQPLMYQSIKNHPTVREIYADQLTLEQVIKKEDAIKMVHLYRESLNTGKSIILTSNPIWHPIEIYSCTESPSNLNANINYIDKKNVGLNYLKKLATHISTIPETIKMQSRVKKIYNDRFQMAIEKKFFDWGAAEILAYATLLDQGISCRLSGEDVERGTFFHRHAVIYNQENGLPYVPLQNIKKCQGTFKIWNSVLSEEAVLAFEYGYAMTSPKTLTIWEAQFGDFANGAQIVIDQFISSSEQKWGCKCGLVMLLPHGYEGQGPEHSSARLERYLQLCAEENMKICMLSTPAQLYHILRLQALKITRRPLIIMSPKSLLRHPQAISSLEDLSSGEFQSVIGEIDQLCVKSVKRIILCSGKIYYDLLIQRRQNHQNNIAIIRIEQLYPFPYEKLKHLLKPYAHVYDFVWCQEEPLNQGAWYFNQNAYQRILPVGAVLRYSGRPASASPAVGYLSVHHQQQHDLINNALTI